MRTPSPTLSQRFRVLARMPRTLYRRATKSNTQTHPQEDLPSAPTTGISSALANLHRLQITQLEQYLRSAGWLSLKSDSHSTLWGRASGDDSGITLRIPQSDTQDDRDEMVFHAICMIVAHESGLKAQTANRDPSDGELVTAFAETRMPLSMAGAFELGVRFALKRAK